MYDVTGEQRGTGYSRLKNRAKRNAKGDDDVAKCLSTPSARVGDMSAASMACRAAPALLRLASSSHVYEPRRRIVAYAKGAAKRDASSGLLSGVHPDSVTAVASIAERAQAASDRWGSEVTEFLDPALAADACVVIDRMADCEARPWGGYDRAERVRLILGRSEVLDGDGEDNFYFRTYAQSV